MDERFRATRHVVRKYVVWLFALDAAHFAGNASVSVAFQVAITGGRSSPTCGSWYQYKPRASLQSARIDLPTERGHVGLIRTVQSLHRSVFSLLDSAPAVLVLFTSFLAGATLGVVARIWMRFITTDPEFSWEATLFILTGFGVALLGQAGVYLGRRSGVRRSALVALRILAVVTLLPLSFGAGAVGFPVIVLAPLAIIRSGWNGWLRVLLGVLASLAVLFLAFTLFSDLSLMRAALGLAWFALIYGVLVWAVSFSFASRDDPRFVRAVCEGRRQNEIALGREHP